MSVMRDSIRWVDNRYQLPLLWYPDKRELPNNRALAYKRLMQLKRKFEAKPHFQNRYIDEMSKFINSGYAERIPETEIKGPENKTWYLPHSAVISEAKQKLRIVYDAASRYQNTSLNDKLITGGDLTNNLLGVLLRFREQTYACTADVESMFLRVSLAPEDRDATRFLFWEGGNINSRPVDYRITVLNFGSKCSPALASFALRRCAVDFGEEFPESTAHHVNRSFYVDDFLASCQSVAETREALHSTRSMIAKGGFKLKKCIANHPQILEDIPSEDKILDTSKPHNVLGLLWYLQEDMLGFQYQEKTKVFTLRGVLRNLSAVYDPTGFLSPYVLKARLLYQELIRDQFKWDQPFDKQHAKTWKRWLQEADDLKTIKLDRCFIPKHLGTLKSIDLHHFGDGSKLAYGTVTYLRLEDISGNNHTVFVQARSRVAPLSENLTVPKLELTAACLCVVNDAFLREQLNLVITDSYFWTDSTVVLSMIANTRKRYEIFFANRIATIDRNSKLSQWRHVPTELNVADHATKGLYLSHSLNG